MRRTVRKAVFPVAGLGTRFLPATKALAKEMLPVVDKPLIQYAVEEAIAAGITHLVFVTGHSKKAIEDHFDRSAELESALESQGKMELLGRVRSILPSHASCMYVRQPAPLGLGHAVSCARPAIGDEPFAILLPDDLIDCPGPGCTEQMVQRFESAGHGLVAVQAVERDEADRYGIVRLASPGRRHGPIEEIVEKPSPDRAPSTLGVVGRYVMPADIFEALERTAPGSGGEIQLTDAISDLLGRKTVEAFPFEGVRYDCGSKEGFLAANIGLALEHDELGPIVRGFLDRGARDQTLLTASDRDG